MLEECAVLASQFASSFSARNCFRGVLRTELKLVFREPTFPLVVFGLLAFCQMLMPPPDAPYAVVTVNQLKPLMSAGPMLLATAAAFGAIAFPAYVLYLGRARARDLKAEVLPLYLSNPVSTWPYAFALVASRLIGRLVLVLGSLWIVLPLLLLSIRLKTGDWPSSLSVLSYFGLSLPVVASAAVAAVVVDALIISPAAKSTVVASLWIALLGLSVSLPTFDFFGLRFIGENIFPGGPPPSLAVGFISGKIATVPWTTLHESSAHLFSRLQFFIGTLGLASLASVGLAATFRLRSLPARRSSSTSRRLPDLSTTLSNRVEHGYPRAASAPVRSVPAQAKTQLRPAWQIVLLIAQRRLRHASWAKALFIVSAIVALVTRQLAHAAPLSLLIPLALVSSRSSRQWVTEQVLRFTNPNLRRPTPAFLETIATWSIVMLSVLPVLIGGETHLLQCAHFVVATLAATAWLVLTHQVVARELFGVSIYLLLWYLVACNRLPATLDLLGVHGTSVPSLLAALILAGILALATSREKPEKPRQ